MRGNVMRTTAVAALAGLSICWGCGGSSGGGGSSNPTRTYQFQSYITYRPGGFDSSIANDGSIVFLRPPVTKVTASGQQIPLNGGGAFRRTNRLGKIVLVTNQEVAFADGNNRTVVAQVSNFPAGTSFSTGDVNDNGVVAFVAPTSTNAYDIWLHESGINTKVVDATANQLTFVPALSINAAKTIVFMGRRQDDSEAIFRWSNGTLDIIADTRSGNFFKMKDLAQINNDGAIVFTAFKDRTQGGIYLYRNGTTTPIVETDNSSFSFIEGAGINSSGEIVFEASYDAGGGGIFTWRNGRRSTVIESGDPLFNSVLRGIQVMGPYSINDSGQVVSYYGLDNGTSGQFVATPR